ncbi:hypothetical protein SAY87_021486 [Trapa incisa]|uniref:Uncharacterized protein n=1 Tax=Trapa incisa TaxID=236973 RepID=A0AAN7PRZ6_9MYRT|nr:hypothetical protein SAY87_021486 [Trapa incisa]
MYEEGRPCLTEPWKSVDKLLWCAYDAVNLLATNFPELKVKATGNPISIHFNDTKSAPLGLIVRSVWINLSCSISFSSPNSGNTCSAVYQGHFSMVVESIAPAPALEMSFAPTPTSGGGVAVPIA